jgi:hypothetical protein
MMEHKENIAKPHVDPRSAAACRDGYGPLSGRASLRQCRKLQSLDSAFCQKGSNSGPRHMPQKRKSNV